MKKLTYAFLFVAMFCVAFGPSVSKAAEYKWKLGHEEIPGGYYDRLGKEFGKRLAANSGGKIELSVFPAETIGSSEDMLELVRNDVIQFNFASAFHTGSLIPETQVLLLHYVFPKDINVVRDVFQKGTFRDILNPCYEAKGLEPLAYGSEGWNVWTSNKVIRTPAEMAAVKFRTGTSRLIVDSYKAYGANPTPVPFSEVYSGLQLNMIEGQENPVFVAYDMKFYEVQSCITFAYAAPFAYSLVSGTKFMSSLPADIQKIVRDTANELIPYAFQLQEEYNNEMMAKIKAEKPEMQIIYLTDAEVAVFAKLAEPVQKLYLEMAPEKGQALLDALKADIKNFSK